MKKIVVSFAFAFFMAGILIFYNPVSAEDFGQISFDTKYTGEITNANTSDRYTVILTEAGRLTISVGSTEGSSLAQAGIRWLDADGTVVRTMYFYYSSADPRVESMDLEAGTYFIEVSRRGIRGPTGAYALSAAFTDANNNETEPNDSRETAQLLDYDQFVTGFISYQDNMDIFKLVLPKAGKLTVSVQMPGDTGVRELRVRWLNADGIVVNSYFKQSSAGADVPGDEMDLEAGEYFIEISQRGGGGTGTYVIKAYFQTEKSGPAVKNPHSSWAKAELEKAYRLGLVPESLEEADLTKPITRAEFAAIAVKAYENLANIRLPQTGENPFTDTKDTEVSKAFAAGITTGVSADKFEPESPISREQAATMLTRAYKKAALENWTFETDENFKLDYKKPAPFSDDDKISDWAKDSVYFMAANGIILGIGENIFAPRNTTEAEKASNYANATREQALVIAVRMTEKLSR